MSNKIEFPYNNKIYLRRALKSIEQEHFEEALNYIEKVYETNKTQYVNRIYTFVLYTLERYEEAFEIASEHKTSYLEDEHQIFMFVLLLIKNHQFIEAEAIIQKETENTSFNKEKWETIKQNLRLEREQLSLEIERKRKETITKLNEIGQYSMFEQSQIINDAHLLKLKDLQKIAPNIFSNLFVSGNIQRAFLELLIKMRDETEYYFPWFNEMKVICPKNLMIFEQLHTIPEINKALENKLHKTPSMIEGIRGEIINDLLLLYPFVDEVITDVNYWVDSYIFLFDPSNQMNKKLKPKNEEQKKLQDWIERLNIIAQRK